MKHLQSLFFTSFHHIARQGKPSLNEKGKCCYRSPDGLSCAAAPFIRHYSPDMEDNNFNWLVDEFPKDIDPVAVQHRGFVMELQLAHDEALRRVLSDPHNRFMTQYIELMSKLAARWDLAMPPAVAMGRATY